MSASAPDVSSSVVNHASTHKFRSTEVQFPGWCFPNSFHVRLQTDFSKKWRSSSPGVSSLTISKYLPVAFATYLSACWCSLSLFSPCCDQMPNRGSLSTKSFHFAHDAPEEPRACGSYELVGFSADCQNLYVQGQLRCSHLYSHGRTHTHLREDNTPL